MSVALLTVPADQVPALKELIHARAEEYFLAAEESTAEVDRTVLFHLAEEWTKMGEVLKRFTEDQQLRINRFSSL